MSDFQVNTKHPETGEYKQAWWLDDYFGRHNYGVKFDGENKVYDVREHEIVRGEDKKLDPPPHKDRITGLPDEAVEGKLEQDKLHEMRQQTFYLKETLAGITEMLHPGKFTPQQIKQHFERKLSEWLKDQ